MRQHRADARAEEHFSHRLEALVILSQILLCSLGSPREEFDTGKHEGCRGSQDVGAEVQKGRPGLAVGVPRSIEVAVQSEEARERVEDHRLRLLVTQVSGEHLLAGRDGGVNRGRAVAECLAVRARLASLEPAVVGESGVFQCVSPGCGGGFPSAGRCVDERDHAPSTCELGVRTLRFEFRDQLFGCL